MSIFLYINCEHRIEIYFLQHILYIVPCTKKSFPFYFQNHDIYTHWTFGSNPDSGGAGLVQAPPRTLFISRTWNTRIHPSPFTPVEIEGGVQVLPR
jgi:hypothetical protein